MADVTGPISASDLETIGGKFKAKTTGRPHGDMNFVKDLGLFLAQVALAPLAIITLIPESRVELAGLGVDFTTSAVLWVLLIACSVTAMLVSKMSNPGRLARYGMSFLAILFAITVPVSMGFTALIFVSFAVGGPEALLIFSKAIGVLAFIYFWFKR